MVDERSEPTLRGRDLAGLGGLLVGAVVAGLVLGLLLDNAADSSPVFTLVGILLGIARRRRRLLAPGPRGPAGLSVHRVAA